jgi:hypothetical protein
MRISAEELLSTAKTYWPADRESELKQERSPERLRLDARWNEELANIDRWFAFLDGLDELEEVLPGFKVGDATATPDASFRCVAYWGLGRSETARLAVLGCKSILAPVYTVYGVHYEVVNGRRLFVKVSFEPLPEEMRRPADIIARKLETAFGVVALPREAAELPVPLIVHDRAPPETTLFHALFTSDPTSFP